MKTNLSTQQHKKQVATIHYKSIKQPAIPTKTEKDKKEQETMSYIYLRTRPIKHPTNKPNTQKQKAVNSPPHSPNL
jgi:hypothetical protein